ncbi:hypothetical protein [Massilia sp. BKSP1R2A-1]|uniref:hypothetical protein n=1 Tax=Massilia sp. BKSP1R2A-1 TaxID=3422595 RepID=UPI003D33C654
MRAGRRDIPAASCQFAPGGQQPVCRVDAALAGVIAIRVAAQRLDRRSDMLFLHARQHGNDHVTLVDPIGRRRQGDTAGLESGARFGFACVIHEAATLPHLLVDCTGHREEPAVIEHDRVYLFRYVGCAYLAAADGHRLGGDRLHFSERRIADGDPGPPFLCRAGRRGEAEAEDREQAELEQTGPHYVSFRHSRKKC